MKYTKGTTIPRKGWRGQRAPRRLLCLLLALLALPFGASASSVPTSMRVALISPGDMELYPLQIMDRDMLSVLDLVYESVVELNDNREPVASLGTWETSTDGKTWVFTIRQGVRFHDGRELTAYDVKATMDAIKALADSDRPANEKGMYTNMANVLTYWNADDTYQLTVRSKTPFYGVPYAMTFPVLQAQAIHTPNPPGTGPYRINYYMPGQEIWLTGNETYWYSPAPHVSEINGIFYSDIDAALRAFEAEEVDIVMTRSTSGLRFRGSTSRTNAYTYATRQLECLLINNYVSNLRSVEMRQAIAYAINKSRLMTNVYQNLVTDTDTLQSPASWLYNRETATYGYDPDRARSILDELGWDNFNENGYRIRLSESGEVRELDLRLYYYDEAGNALRKEAANQIATMLRDVGIRVRVTGFPFADGVSKLTAGDFDLFLCAYNFDVVPDPYFILHSSSGKEGNYIAYRSDEMNKLCNELRSAGTAAEFKLGWDAIQALMAEELPFVPLYWRQGIMLARYPFSSVRDIREFELLKSIDSYK